MKNNERVTVICATDRPDSNSMKVAATCAKLLNGAPVLNLRDIRAQWLAESAYGHNVPELDAVLEKYVRGVGRLVVVAPEYNGSFPGILKYFIDACDHGEWAAKRVALIGVATGRGGNLRGIDHLTGIFHYLGSEVFSRKVYVSQVSALLGVEGLISDERTIAELRLQLNTFLEF